jgi:c-di-GMP-binding flagellar brake protein YcgR
LLNNKLDFLIEQIFLHSSGTPPARDDVIDMSASGLKFTCREHLPKGSLLKMDLVIPGTFQFQMELISEVVRVEAREGGYIVAVHIVEIEEGSRESIVKAVFQKQRMDIRGGRMNREEQDGP